jgi:hypothetical protein
MNRLRLTIMILVALLIVAGCGGSKFAKEKTVLDTMASAMETFTSTVNSADTPAGITQALGSFSGVVEKLVPQMKSLTADHPDWEKNPPEELKETFDKFNNAKTGFQNAMPKVTAMAKDNLGDADLQNAVNKFIGLVKDL